MTTINRATWTDDDGSGMTGTILNNARLQVDIYDKVDGALATLDTKDASQDTAIAANGPHSILSAQHPDTTPAALVAGDLLVVGAGGKLVRLPKGTNGQVLSVVSGLPAYVDAGVPWTTTTALSVTSDIGTVTAGGTSVYYAVIQTTLFFQWTLTNWTTTGSPTQIFLALPAGYTNKNAALMLGMCTNSTTPLNMYGQLVPGETRVRIRQVGGAAWPNSTTMSWYGQLVISI